jgi:hypothetical protein
VFSEAEIDRLAQLEHNRWRADRKASGWRYAPDRDNEHLLHPGIQPWNELAPGLRQRNQELVRDIPAILSDAGFQIVHR